jgi:hypothetical protein
LDTVIIKQTGREGNGGGGQYTLKCQAFHSQHSMMTREGGIRGGAITQVIVVSINSFG